MSSTLVSLGPAGFITIVVAAWATVFALLFISAPYGRHDRPGWGPAVPQRLAWLLMEAPSFIAFVLGWLWGGAPRSALGWALGMVWVLHYGYRSFIYPLVIRPRPGATMKILLVLMAVVFNVINGGLNGLFVGDMNDPGFPLEAIIGLSLVAMGAGLNHWADAVLRDLRASGAGYQIPRGGLYRWVSCPNYLGELIEWVGFAVATGSPFAWAFALFTAANLVPRAMASHQWYRRTFKDYPADRRAIVPYLL